MRIDGQIGICDEEHGVCEGQQLFWILISH